MLLTIIGIILTVAAALYKEEIRSFVSSMRLYLNKKHGVRYCKDCHIRMSVKHNPPERNSYYNPSQGPHACEIKGGHCECEEGGLLTSIKPFIMDSIS